MDASKKNIKVEVVPADSEAEIVINDTHNDKEHEMNTINMAIEDSAESAKFITSNVKEQDMNKVESVINELRILSAIDPEDTRKGVEFTPTSIGAFSGIFDDMDDALYFSRSIRPELVGHIKKTESGKVKVFWAPEGADWNNIPKICKLASRPGRTSESPQIVTGQVGTLPDGVFICAPTGVVRKFNIDHGMKNIDGPCQVSSFDIIGKGTILPGDVDEVTISDDCGLPIGTEVKIDLGKVSAFQNNFKGRMAIGPRLLINATNAATYGDPVYIKYAKFLHKKFDAWYRTLPDTENGQISYHSSGAIAELAYHRLPTPMSYLDRLSYAVSTAAMGRRQGPKVQTLSGYAFGLSNEFDSACNGSIPYGVIVDPTYTGVVTVMVHRNPGIHHRTFALPALLVGRASRSDVRKGLKRVGISITPNMVSELCDIAHREIDNSLFMNPEFWLEVQGDCDGDNAQCVPFNHRARVQDYKPGITDEVNQLVVGRVGDAANPQDRIDELKTSALNAIGIVDSQTHNELAYYASNWRDINRKIRRSHLDLISKEYTYEYQVSIFGNKKRTSYVSHANEIHKKFQESRGMDYHPDSVINRVLKSKELWSIPDMVEKLYLHQKDCNTRCMITDKWINAYMGIMESRVSLVRDTSWAESWDRFLDPPSENPNTGFVIGVIYEAYNTDGVDWNILVRWAAETLSEDGASLADIARLIIPNRKNVVARNVTLALSVARILGIDLTPVRHVLRRKPRVVDVELFGKMDYHPDYLDSVVDDGDDNLGYDDDDMTEF